MSLMKLMAKDNKLCVCRSMQLLCTMQMKQALSSKGVDIGGYRGGKRLSILNQTSNLLPTKIRQHRLFDFNTWHMLTGKGESIRSA